MNIKIIPLHLHPMGFIESFCLLGASLESLLKDTHINVNMLTYRDSKISYRQFNTLIKNGLRLCDTPGLGLVIGNKLDWCYYGTMGSIMSCTPSLKDACNAYFRYLSIPQPFHAARSHERKFFINPDNMVVDTISTLGPTDGDKSIAEFEMEFQLATLLRIGDLCGNKSAANPSVHVSLHYPEPEHVAMYNTLPCSTITFSCKRSTVSAHVDFIMKNWREFRKPAFDKIVKQCEEELRHAIADNSLSSKVRWLIYTNYFHNTLSLEQISESLQMTPRSLTRKLAHENENFRNLYHEVRMDMTSQHLKHSKLSTADIARLMRFSSISSLRRAIKNWSGSTLRDYRSSLTY